MGIKKYCTNEPARDVTTLVAENKTDHVFMVLIGIGNVDDVLRFDSSNYLTLIVLLMPQMLMKIL